MLTEVDVKRIMAAKMQLAESITDHWDIEQSDDDEIFEVMEEDTSVTETNGLM
ncbi:MAG: hypothetical protein JSW45_07895 [Thiotrichales bacterium]|nr:MAG: hypothetical protein JSW45_07895 [Thiotrichales bacterium]